MIWILPSPSLRVNCTHQYFASEISSWWAQISSIIEGPNWNVVSNPPRIHLGLENCRSWRRSISPGWNNGLRSNRSFLGKKKRNLILKRSGNLMVRRSQRIILLSFRIYSPFLWQKNVPSFWEPLPLGFFIRCLLFSLKCFRSNVASGELGSMALPLPLDLSM